MLSQNTIRSCSEVQGIICYLQLCDDGHTFVAVMVLVLIIPPYLQQRSKICETTIDCFMASMGHTHFFKMCSAFAVYGAMVLWSPLYPQSAHTHSPGQRNCFRPIQKILKSGNDPHGTRPCIQCSCICIDASSQLIPYARPIVLV